MNTRTIYINGERVGVRTWCLSCKPLGLAVTVDAFGERQAQWKANLLASVMSNAAEILFDIAKKKGGA